MTSKPIYESFVPSERQATLLNQLGRRRVALVRRAWLAFMREHPTLSAIPMTEKEPVVELPLQVTVDTDMGEYLHQVPHGARGIFKRHMLDWYWRRYPSEIPMAQAKLDERRLSTG